MKRQVAEEHFYTPPELAAQCLKLVTDHFALSQFDLLVEPSAGAGAFYDLLPANARLGIDINPRHPDIRQADFFYWQPPPCHNALTIGNPPFGQRGALAIKFLCQAATFSSVIGFILPRSFQKYTFQNRVPQYFHLCDSFECQDFLNDDGELVTVNSVFQIWEKREIMRDLVLPPAEHPHFALKHAHLSRTTATQLACLRESYEFTVPQVGQDFRPREVGSVTKGSHWFVKPQVPGVREVFERLDFSFLDGKNTAHKSLSKRDIVMAYQNAMV
ncbi:MAG: hypothetical protein FWG25_10595 [Promicromonosporaceae bacterium]|nr:hypothetical protein [Promicromonosporaceae bacterium]